MLVLLQPGIEPLGQFDIEDDDMTAVAGGEVGRFRALDIATDGYAADVFPHQGPVRHIFLGAAQSAELYGLVDEGTSGGSPDTERGYGTLFGSVIGGTAGQGTGIGTLSGTGTVVVGPHTMFGSGKATLWTKPGLYGVTADAWESAAEFTTGETVNTVLYGDATNATRGKLTTAAGGNGVQVATSLGPETDRSLVSTTTQSAGGTSTTDFMVLYLLGVSIA
jgi:hypothetical protein